jgi:hypothetical protein
MILEIVVYTLAWMALVIGATLAVYRVSDAPAFAPGIDVVMGLFTWGPWLVAGCNGGWAGFWACVLGQFIALQAFCIFHTSASGYRGPKIRHALDRTAGVASNHLGLWATVPALPAFIMLRIAELLFYPLLVATLRFPRYRHAEWVNVSRQKFEGLVGHDLVWCLYCDWMTGVYSLGGEMLRNVESFWCPIRFYADKKCENCRLDFPDVKEWVDAGKSMKDVSNLLLEKYPPGSREDRSWFGHPGRKKRQ